MKFSKFELKWKIVLALGMLLVPVMALGMMYTLDTVKKFEVHTAMSGLMNFVDAKQQGVIRFLGQNEKLAKQLAVLVENADPEVARKHFATIVATDVFKPEEHPFQQEINEGRRRISAWGAYHAIDFVRHGTIEISSDPARIGRKMETAPDIGHGYSDVYRDGDVPILSFGAKSGDGMVYVHANAGMLTLIVNGEIGNLEGDMGAYYLAGVGKTFDYYMVNRDNVMITDSRVYPDALLKRKGSEFPRMMTLGKAASLGITALPDGTYKTNAGHFTGHREAMGFYEGRNGKEMLGVSMPFYDSQWTIVVEQEASELLGPLYTMNTHLVIIAVIVCFIIMVAGLVLATSISRPVSILSHAARRLSEGDFDSQLPTPGKDEIGNLVKSFASMRLSISQSHERLAQANAEIEASEVRFRDFGASASDWYWEMDENLRFSYFSEAFTDVTGVPQDRLLGKTRREDGNPGAPPEEWRGHLDNLSNQRPFRNFVHPRTLPNGKVVWLSINGKPVFGEDGRFRGYRGTGMDITESKESRQRLLDLSSAIDEMSEPVAVFDNEDRFIFTNEAYRNLFGPGVDSIQIGEKFEDHARAVVQKRLIPDAIGREEDWLAERLSQHRNPSDYFEIKRPEGVWLLGIEKKLPSGGQVLLLTDISDIKKSQNELVLARDDAERANRAKSEFLSSMSHELRTPMNAILGFAQLLESSKKDPLTDGQKNNVSHIMSGGGHLLELIDQVLDLAKIEAGKLEITAQEIVVEEVCRECLTLTNKSAKDRGLRVDGDFFPTLTIRTDYIRFKQVLLNLLSNAVKYNRDGGNVTLSSKNAPGNMVRISVSDTGIGIADDRRNVLFEPFNRLGKEMGDIEGTGIGLTIARQLVEAMGGHIGYESKIGKGSTFWVEFPAIERTEVTPGERAEISEKDVQHERPDTPATVLYIEDNPANLQLMEAIIDEMDRVSMISTHTAELGVSMAEDRQPDLILMDINLPGMDGVAAMEVLAEIDRTKDIPVLAVSANAMKHDIERALVAGFKAYLTKPFNVPEVVAAIEKELGA